MTYSISRYNNKRDNAPKRQELSLKALAVLLTNHEFRTAKDGALWSPAKIRENGKRQNDDVESVSCLVLDFDKGLAWDDFLSEWDGVAAIVHTTHSHTDGCPKWRAIFPLTAPVPASEWPEIYRKLAQHFGFGAVDPACKDVSRMYYVPAALPGAPVFTRVLKGKLLNPGEIHADEQPDIDAVKPGDDYDTKTSWAELLEPYGWQLVPNARYCGTMDLWSREGKQPRKGEHGARTGEGAAGDRMVCWTSSTPLPAGRALRKWHVYAHYEHGGDFSAAARALASKGFGQQISKKTSTYTQGLPEIRVNNQHLRDLTCEALAAVEAQNDPPRIFSRDGLLVRIEKDEEGLAKIETLNAGALKGVCSRAANWYRETKEGARTYLSPPNDVVEDILNLGTIPDCAPALRGIVAAPVFSAAGTVQLKAGYDPLSRWYLTDEGPWPKSELTGPEAAERFVDDVLCDFPFADDASRSHAVALFLLPFVRPLIDGPTPLHLIDAPTPGTGKGKLAKVCLMPALGYEPNATPLPDVEEEVKKMLLSLFLGGEQVIFLDNINRKVRSASLESALTTVRMGGRILGISKFVTTQIRSIFVATSNNGQFSTDMARRSLWIRLDAKLESPEKRESFKHASIEDYIRSKRHTLVSLAHAMVFQWIRDGKPKSDKRKGTYENWANVIGGILTVCNISGFLDNDKALKEATAPDESMWEDFYMAWWDQYSETPVTTKELMQLAKDKELCTTILARAHSERSEADVFGRAVASQIDRVRGGLVPTKATKQTGTRRFKIAQSGGLVVSTPPPTRTGARATSSFDEKAKSLERGEFETTRPPSGSKSGGLSDQKTTMTTTDPSPWWSNDVENEVEL